MDRNGAIAVSEGRPRAQRFLPLGRHMTEGQSNYPWGTS